jgi:hypothetical protein
MRRLIASYAFDTKDSVTCSGVARAASLAVANMSTYPASGPISVESGYFSQVLRAHSSQDGRGTALANVASTVAGRAPRPGP